MNLRVALAVLVLSFVGVLLVMGAVSFVRWLRLSYPRQYRSLLTIIVLLSVGLVVWIYFEARERPSFQPDDVITLGEPLVVRLVPTERLAATMSCIVEVHEHLAILAIESGTIKAGVESNKGTGPSFCPIGAEVQFEAAWLHRYTVTQRQPSSRER